MHTAAKSTDTAKAFLATVAAEQGFSNAPWKGLVVFSAAASVESVAGDDVGGATYGNGTKNGGQMVISARPKTDAVLQNSVSHEFGHFFSISHANRLGCADGSVDSLPNAAGTGWANASCATIAYDDNNDIMSNSYSGGALNSVLATSAGIVKSTDVLDVTATATTTSYTLLPWADKTTTKAKAIRIADPATGNPFYVELREPVGLDSTDATGVRAGVKILKKNSAGTGSVVLDPSPTTKTLNTDGKQTWDQGSVFVNASQTIAVTITQVGGTQATVSVTKITPSTAAAFQSAAASKSVQVTAQASTGNSYYAAAGSLAISAKNSAGTGVSGTVTVSEGTTVLGTATLPASGVATFALPNTVTAGVHNYTLVHSNSTVRSGSVDYTVAKAQSTVSATAAQASAATTVTTNAITVKVTIGAGTGLVGSVAVTRDGADAGTVELTKANGGIGSYPVGALAAGTHTFGFSYAGAANTGAATSTVTVTATSAASTVVATSAGTSTYYTTQATLALKAKPGTVTISENGATIGTATVPASGSVNYLLPKTISAGTHSYTLTHSDASVTPGSVSQVVAKAATITAATASATSVPAGTASATVAVSASIGGTTSLVGSVTVTDNGVAMPAVALTSANKGVGSYAIGALTAGSHTLVFSYAGGASTQPSSVQVAISAR